MSEEERDELLQTMAAELRIQRATIALILCVCAHPDAVRAFRSSLASEGGVQFREIFQKVLSNFSSDLDRGIATEMRFAKK